MKLLLLWTCVVVGVDRVPVKINPGTGSGTNTYNYGGNVYTPTAETPASFRQPNQFTLSEWSSEMDETAWRHVMSPCLSYITGEYRYEVCLFKNVSQFKPGQQFHINLGVFDTWIAPMKMRYTDGNPCASGKRRSTVVSLLCAEETILANMAEPSTCEYSVDLKLPLACSLHQPDLAGTPLAMCSNDACLHGVDTLFDCIHALWIRQSSASEVPKECEGYVPEPTPVMEAGRPGSEAASPTVAKGKQIAKHGRWDLRHPVTVPPSHTDSSAKVDP